MSEINNEIHTSEEVSQILSEKPDGNTKSSGARNQLYRWFFTIPYEAISLSQLSQDLSTFCKKYTFSGELSKSGYKHWQGCFSLKEKMYFHTVKNIFPESAHLQACKDWWKAVNYCKKEETHIEGPYDENTIFSHIELPKKLYDWQERIVHMANQKPNDRIIHWFWEENGCTGKTTLCKYLAVKYDAVVLNNCSTRDGSFALPNNPKIVVVNLTRSNEGHINYGLLEAIKDGLIFSPKYESKMKIFNSPHIFVFANCEPDTSMMSKDRWRIHKLSTRICEETTYTDVLGLCTKHSIEGFLNSSSY